tara:strand:- start:7163 stop:7447 length:285 start_codon:yes stop_codon:yes gene_type:complete
MSILKPWNRRVLLDVIPSEPDDSDTSTILVPDDYKPRRNDHVLARVLSVSSDANQYLDGRKVIVQPNGLEEFVDTDGNLHVVALENYIVAVMED